MSRPPLILVVPGLSLPAQMLRDLSFDLPLPALRRLLADARPASLPVGLPVLDALLRPQNLAGAAPLRLLGLGGTPGADDWLCLDPVHLGFRERQIVVQDPSALRLQIDEARQLAIDIAPLFAELGTLQVDAPAHWHLRLHRPAPDFPSLTAAISAQASIGLVADRAWQRVLNEAQMLLHSHPLNQARASRELQPVNSLWPWGGGRLPASPVDTVMPTMQLQSDDPCLRGLAQALGQQHTALSAAYCGTGGHGLTTVVDLAGARAAASAGDAAAWRQALLDLEARWFAPLLAHPAASVLLACPAGDHVHCLRLSPAPALAPLRRLWRRLRGAPETDPLLKVHAPE